MVEAKEAAGKSPRYTKNLSQILNQFCRTREHRPIAEITEADVADYLDSKELVSRSTLRARLSTLFKYAIRKGYRIDNPCVRLEPVTVPHRPPAVFSVEQTAKLLAFLQTRQKPDKHSSWVDYRYALPWFVLSTFCGLRPEEAEQTRRADIHIKEGWIKVEAQTSKIRQRRVVYPPQAALVLLAASLNGGEMPLTRQRRRRIIKRLRKVLGWKAWPKDVTRHTAASYWLALCGSAATVAEALGHSEAVLKKNYKALVTREEANRFWALCKGVHGIGHVHVPVNTRFH
jgi:integrase